MKIKHLFLALVIGTLAFASCKKQETPSANNDRTPLAMRTASGDIVSLVDCEKLTKQLQAQKNENNRFVIESVFIKDKTDDQPYYFVVKLLDIQTEATISCAYVGDFVEEDSNVFYAVKDFEDGNYKVTDPNGDEFKFKNHNLVEPNDPEPEMEPIHGFWIACEGRGCTNQSCVPNYFRCTECVDLEPDTNPGLCQKAGLGWGSGALVGLLSGALGWILK